MHAILNGISDGITDAITFGLAYVAIKNDSLLMLVGAFIFLETSIFIRNFRNELQKLEQE